MVVSVDTRSGSLTVTATSSTTSIVVTGVTVISETLSSDLSAVNTSLVVLISCTASPVSVSTVPSEYVIVYSGVVVVVVVTGVVVTSVYVLVVVVVSVLASRSISVTGVSTYVVSVTLSP